MPIRSFESQGDERLCAELDGCTSEPTSVVLIVGKRVAQREDDTFLCECQMSPPRATDNLVEKCPYTSGGRNAGVSGKRGYVFREVTTIPYSFGAIIKSLCL